MDPQFAFLASSQVMLTQVVQGSHHEDESNSSGRGAVNAPSQQGQGDRKFRKLPEVGRRQSWKEGSPERGRLLVEAKDTFQKGD